MNDGYNLPISARSLLEYYMDDIGRAVGGGIKISETARTAEQNDKARALSEKYRSAETDRYYPPKHIVMERFIKNQAQMRRRRFAKKNRTLSAVRSPLAALICY